VLYSRGSVFIRLPCPYRTVPYRFPRGTVLVDRAAYRNFLTVFRDFCLKARTLSRFKFYRSSVLTLIFRKSRRVPYQNTNRFSFNAFSYKFYMKKLITVFSFKKRNFYRYDSRFLQKRPIFHYGTARTNAFFRIDLF
jgi:hypothetical protein